MVCSRPPARASKPEENALPKEEAGEAEKTIRVTRVMPPISPGAGPAATSSPAANAHSGFQHDGERVIAPAEAAGEDREGDEEGGAEHAAAAMQIRVVAIREGDVERAGGGHRAARRIAQRDADDERDRHAQRVAQSHHRRKPRAVKLPDGRPEAGRQANSRRPRSRCQCETNHEWSHKWTRSSGVRPFISVSPRARCGWIPWRPR